MRTMLLSFRADVYQKVKTGKKIYEHRKVFPDEPIRAYLYISSPVKAIGGIMYLDNKTSLHEWKERYHYDRDALERIDAYLKQHQFAMEIKEFQDTNHISLYQLRKDLPGFVVPQMYYFIDGTPLLDYLESNLEPVGNKITHRFEKISSRDICVH